MKKLFPIAIVAGLTLVSCITIEPYFPKRAVYLSAPHNQLYYKAINIVKEMGFSITGGTEGGPLFDKTSSYFEAQKLDPITGEGITVRVFFQKDFGKIKTGVDVLQPHGDQKNLDGIRETILYKLKFE